MRIEAIPVQASDLRPGDLFSGVGPWYWDHRPSFSVGEKVYIRTEHPPADEDDAKFPVYRIIIHEDFDG